ncbi:MAG: GNAT family N-acetyltransferase [bacterium]|nr:GNAT family N-acetyltransferase [bacterium]
MFILEKVKPEDREEILSFTSNTWNWGDYIPEVFNEWLDPKNGDFIKVLLDNKIVGISHIGYLSNWETWLEGLRVHPDYRHIGAGTFILDSTLELLREKGIKVARNAIISTNVASQNLVKKRSFKCVGEFLLFSRKGEKIDVKGLRKAEAKDIEKLLNIAKEDAKENLSLKNVGAYWRWEWQELSYSALERMINNALVLTDQEMSGFGVIRESNDDIEVSSLYGDPKIIEKVMLYGLNLGYETGISECAVIIPKDWKYKDIVERLNFKPSYDENMFFIFEKSIV